MERTPSMSELNEIMYGQVIVNFTAKKLLINWSRTSQKTHGLQEVGPKFSIAYTVVPILSPSCSWQMLVLGSSWRFPAVLDIVMLATWHVVIQLRLQLSNSRTLFFYCFRAIRIEMIIHSFFFSGFVTLFRRPSHSEISTHFTEVVMLVIIA